MDDIQKKYANCAVRYDTMWLYFIRDAMDVVRTCEARQIRVYGLDAFRLSGKGIQPSMNNSLWLEKDASDNYRKAMEHLSMPENEPYLFELWYDGY